MSSPLTAEVPTLHGTLITLTLRESLHINKLTDAEMARSQTIADREEILWCDHEFGQVLLRGQVEFQEMTCLRLL